MEPGGQKTFGCTVIAPTGKVVDCLCTSAVIPAHDGQRGILYDHAPMFCQLGMGILKVTSLVSEPYKEPSEVEVLLFVDGGFALVASNSILVTAYESFAVKDMKAERIEALIDRISKGLAAPTMTADQRTHETAKVTLLKKIAEMCRTGNFTLAA